MSRITTQSYKEQQHNSLLEKNVMKIQMLTNFLYIFINCPCITTLYESRFKNFSILTECHRLVIEIKGTL